jgi:hypothetical protein
MESENIQMSQNDRPTQGDDLLQNNSNDTQSFSLNSSYVAVKSKINLLIENNVNPIFNALKNNGYGKLLVALVALFSVVFGYITMTLLQTLYFVSCSVNSVRAIKNDQDLKPIVNNWVTYSAVVLIFYILDMLSYITGDVIKIVFDACKFVLLFCLYGSSVIQENLNYGMSRVYSCNNRIIDTTQNSINTVLGYVYQSCNKENFDEIIQSISKLTSKEKSN